MSRKRMGRVAKPVCYLWNRITAAATDWILHNDVIYIPFKESDPQTGDSHWAGIKRNKERKTLWPHFTWIRERASSFCQLYSVCNADILNQVYLWIYFSSEDAPCSTMLKSIWLENSCFKYYLRRLFGIVAVFFTVNPYQQWWLFPV